MSSDVSITVASVDVMYSNLKTVIGSLCTCAGNPYNHIYTIDNVIKIVHQHTRKDKTTVIHIDKIIVNLYTTQGLKFIYLGQSSKALR